MNWISTTFIAPPALCALFVTIWYALPMIVRWVGVRRLDRRCRRERVLVLTFDDGPGPRLTPRVLDLLAERSAKATFFCTGFRARRYPGLMDRVVAEGHEVGTHSSDHLHAWKVAPGWAARDQRAGARELRPWLPASGLVRPPYGKLTLDCLLDGLRRKLRFGWWTIVNGELDEPTGDPGRAAQELRERDGGVVLLHDFDSGPEREAFVLQSLTNLIDMAEAADMRIVPLGAVLHSTLELRDDADRPRHADDMRPRPIAG